MGFQALLLSHPALGPGQLEVYGLLRLENPWEAEGSPASLEECLAERRRGQVCHSLLFSFMNVHMSLSSGLCAKEQLPTYWHLRPFCAWMQSWGEGAGEPVESHQ